MIRDTPIAKLHQPSKIRGFCLADDICRMEEGLRSWSHCTWANIVAVQLPMFPIITNTKSVYALRLQQATKCFIERLDAVAHDIEMAVITTVGSLLN
jgi:hypothetical protein